MDDKKYIGVTEFSRLSGISRQTVYNRMKTDLAEYVKLVDGKSVIDSGALEMFSQSDTPTSTPIDDNGLTPFLREQITVKDSQILALEAQMSVKDVQIAELNERLKEAIKLNENSQVLLLNKQQVLQEEKRLLLEEPGTPPAKEPEAAKRRTILDRFKSFFE